MSANPSSHHIQQYQLRKLAIHMQVRSQKIWKDCSTLHQGESKILHVVFPSQLTGCSPCYDGLKNNVSTRLLETTLNKFPAGTADYVTHKTLADYIQDTSISTGVHTLTQYDTNVKNVLKKGESWSVETATLQTDTAGVARWKTSVQVITFINNPFMILMLVQDFDAVVVASGHYHAARVPTTPGLADWKKRWPDRVEHSKRYRRPENAQNKVCIAHAGHDLYE
jgi:hypothetical protein